MLAKIIVGARNIDATEIIANRIATRIRQLPEVEFTLVTAADDPARTQNVATVSVVSAPNTPI